MTAQGAKRLAFFVNLHVVKTAVSLREIKQAIMYLDKFIEDEIEEENVIKKIKKILIKRGIIAE